MNTFTTAELSVCKRKRPQELPTGKSKPKLHHPCPLIQKPGRLLDIQTLQESQRTVSTFLRRICFLLREVCEHNDQSHNRGKNCPNASIDGHRIERILHRAMVAGLATQDTVIVALVLMDRVQKAGLPLDQLALKQLFPTCLIISAKYHSDITVWNAEFLFMFDGLNAEVVGALEVQILRLLDWKVHVSEDLFARYQHAVFAPLSRTSE